MTDGATPAQRFEQAVLAAMHDRHGIEYSLWLDDYLSQPDAQQPAELARERDIDPDPLHAGFIANVYRSMADQEPHREAVAEVRDAVARARAEA